MAFEKVIQQKTGNPLVPGPLSALMPSEDPQALSAVYGLANSVRYAVWIRV
jgi:hypothetical protein